MNFLNYFWGYSLVQSINVSLNANIAVLRMFVWFLILSWETHKVSKQNTLGWQNLFWFATHPQSHKMNKTELPVIAFKMVLVSVSVTAKCADKYVLRCPSVPYLEYVFGLTGPEYKTQHVCFWLSSLLVSVTTHKPPFALGDVWAVFKQQPPPLAWGRIRRSNSNLFPLKKPGQR